MPFPSAPDLVVEGFIDAINMAFGLWHAHPHFATAVGLDRHGVVRDLTLFTDPDDTIEDAVWWAECAALNDALISQVLLIDTPAGLSTGPAPEAWLGRFAEIREHFDLFGVSLLDWLRTDGDSVRSMAISDGGSWER